MNYNLTPITNLLDNRIPNSNVWKDRIESFFGNEEYDSELQDWYYNALITNTKDVVGILSSGQLIDSYTGLFSFDTLTAKYNHTFNVALFISSHYQHFYGKKILTVCADYGILNIQMKLCGLDLVSSVQKEYLNVGSVLACIGNNCPPYPINKFDFPEEDVVFMCSVFSDEDLSYKNWVFMVEKKLEGKEVFFDSSSFFQLKNFINYDKIEVVIDPRKVYNEEDYSNMSYGYMNKIYRLK